MPLRYLHLVIFSFICLSANASPKYNTLATYSDITDHSKTLIQFEAGISENEQIRLLENLSQAYSYFFIPAPALAIVNTRCLSTSEYFSFIESLEKQTEIRYAGIYINNGLGDQFGILPSVFVKLKSATDLHILETSLEPFGISQPSQYEYNPLIYKVKLDGNSLIHPLDLAIRLHNSNRFEFAEPNYLLNPDVHTTDPLYYKQWALENTGDSLQWGGTAGADMSVPEAWTITTGDPDILIAVLDSGVDTTHAEFYQQLETGFDAIGEGTKGYPTPNYRSDGHGTACAGIIGADADNGHGIAGVAHDCSMVPVRIFYYVDTTWSGFDLGVTPFSSSEMLADGVNWSWQVAGADIQNHSWGLADIYIIFGFPPGNPALVDDALDNSFTMGRNGLGSLHFFSSGNDGAPPYWPGRDSHSISVNATSMCDEAKTLTSCDSSKWEGNFGVNLDFSAPGVRITTTDMRGANGFTTNDYMYGFGGTSASCPNAAGVGGLVLSANKYLTATEVKNIMSETCDKIGGYWYGTWSGVGTWCEEVGHGRLNAFKAVERAAWLVDNKEIEAAKTLQCYPNPATDQLTIVVDQNGEKHLQLFNTTGQLVIKHSFNNNIDNLTIDHLPQGCYFLRVQVNDQRFSQKIIIQ